MSRLSLLCAVFFANTAFAEPIVLGPIVLNVPAEYEIETDNETVLLGYVPDGRKANAYLSHFNVQVLRLDEMPSNELDAVQELDDLTASLQRAKRTSYKTAGGYGVQQTAGFANDVQGYTVAAFLNGDMYSIYVALIDVRSSAIAESFFQNILAQIDGHKL